MPLNKDKFEQALGRTQSQVYHKTCQACWEKFTTDQAWSKRCNTCHLADAPYTKKVYNDFTSPF